MKVMHRADGRNTVLTCLLFVSISPIVGIVHGTIDVVVSTKDGFVLATDGRQTVSTGAETIHTDDAQKLYPVGGRAACVIAGLVGSETSSSGFELRDALGTTLRELDRSAREQSTRASAAEIASWFQFGFSRVSGLLNPTAMMTPGIVAQLSVVSMTEDGIAEWFSFDLPLRATPDSAGRMTLTAGQPFYRWHSSYLGHRFDVDILGQPAVARRLLGRNVSSAETYTKAAIMRRYYLLKREGRLDQFTLNEGVSLARHLVQSTIDLAPPEAGVGGPIDIAVVTNEGFKWVQKKTIVAAVPPSHARVFDSRLPLQNLDNLQCVRCDFTDARLFYAGNADVQLIESRFGGACRLALAPEAEARRPEVVLRLKSLVQGKCKIIVQNSNYP